MFDRYPKDKVFSMEKSPKEELQFAICERKGGKFADVRVYFIQEDGSKVPTHKGLFINVELLPEVKKGLDRVIEAAHPKAA